MGSKSVASIIIATLFFATLCSAHVPIASQSKHCPDLSVCVNVVKDLLSIIIGAPQAKPCCSLIAGLIDVEAHLCICAAVKADILGININIPIEILLNLCGRKVPKGHAC
ncbi:lipid transfer protein EARLI 1-like [Vicia villosa]|uniref:lipid transfer protein EARLI 1-like n=1 Tax=Vicia villosa TaxID=3911 RepID=UPI00273BD153|nr:lipid transfer protein EARLI 1-like [Vicia villosa]XP_058768577.1 lipid transfer protein EARLI 1-like [Vicia villosa]